MLLTQRVRVHHVAKACIGPLDVAVALADASAVALGDVDVALGDTSAVTLADVEGTLTPNAPSSAPFPATSPAPSPAPPSAPPPASLDTVTSGATLADVVTTFDDNLPASVPTQRTGAPVNGPITLTPTCLAMSIFIMLALVAQFGWSISRFGVVKAHMLAPPLRHHTTDGLCKSRSGGRIFGSRACIYA